tara:strand:- start:13 stop:237 length:225 start_codon:yes stop_codon:yes gene_type:complete
MKFILILHVCSFLDINYPECYTTHVVPLEFDSYKSCILQGYKSSHNTLKEIYEEKIEDKKLAIRFQCKEIGEIT